MPSYFNCWIANEGKTKQTAVDLKEKAEVCFKRRGASNNSLNELIKSLSMQFNILNLSTMLVSYEPIVLSKLYMDANRFIAKHQEELT